MKNILRFCALIILASCNNASSGGRHNKAEGTQQKLTNKNRYIRLQGTIAGKPVAMNLTVFEKEIGGSYYYEEYGQLLRLTADKDTVLKGDSTLLFEDNGYRGEGDFNNSFMVLKIGAGKVSGEWISGDQKTKYPVALTEDYAPGSSRFTIYGVADSLKYDRIKNDPPTAKSSVMLMQPETQGHWYQNILVNMLGGTGGQMSVEEYAGFLSTRFLDSYKKEADTLLQGRDTTGTSRFAFLNYDYNVNENVMYNANGYAVVNVGNYSYTGGAHGMYTNLIACLDMQKKVQIKLSDILQIDSVSLQNLLEKNFRKQQRLAADAPLNTVLFENTLKPNDNFYFTNKVLGFLYNPYEVAAYVYGQITVSIPFTELKPYLNPEFVRRMKL